MTDTNVDATPNTEATTSAEETKRKGRPRPEATIARDEQVLSLVAGAGANGMTRSQIADDLQVDGNTAYLSLFRLRQAGKVSRVRNGTDHVWVVVDTAAA